MAPSKRIKILSVFGTRPEAIKMAPLIKALKAESRFRHFLLVTAQHREMLDQVLELFSIKVDFDLNIMQTRQSLSQITTRALKGLDRIIEEVRPDLVLVHGDTTSTFVGALSAFYHKIPVAHVEAGLRSFDRFNPYPEEMNRKLTDTIADIFFAPTPIARGNLLREGVSREKILVTGNTVVDALSELSSYLDNYPLPQAIPAAKPFVLIEVHRRENWGKPLRDIATAIHDLAHEFSEFSFVLSLHKNPVVRECLLPSLSTLENVIILEPLSYIGFLALMKKCYIIITDSGGIQEEAPSFHRPVLVTRQVTERPEGVKADTLKVVGTTHRSIFNACKKLILDEKAYRSMTLSPNPFGDGLAALRIRDYLLYFFGFLADKPMEFELSFVKKEKK